MTELSNTQAIAVQWYWKSNPNPWSETEPAEWSRYSDMDNATIEQAYQQQQDEVILPNNYKIDFKNNIEMNVAEPSHQRPLYRQAAGVGEERSHRFNAVHLPSKTFVDGSVFCKYIWEWASQHNNSCFVLTEEDAPRIVQLAIDGIAEESKLHTQDEHQDKVEEILNGLRAVQNAGLVEIGKQCIRAYTIDCFLFRALNITLRNEDLSKLTTLGPFCFLLQNALWHSRGSIKSTQLCVYRGGKYKREDIEQYQAAIGQTRCWSAFTSTTCDETVTNKFTDKPIDDQISTSFIINIIDRPFAGSFGLDISHMSAEPKESEVLLPAGINFTTDRVDYDESAQKCTIFLTI